MPTYSAALAALAWMTVTWVARSPPSRFSSSVMVVAALAGHLVIFRALAR